MAAGEAPKSGQLRLVAEELYTLATKRVRGSPIRCGLGTSTAKHTGGSSGMGGLADLLSDSRTEQAPMELKLAQAAVPACVAESLAAHRLRDRDSSRGSAGRSSGGDGGHHGRYGQRRPGYRVMSSNGRVHAPGERENQSPQMNFLVRWLVERWSNVQFLAVWVPGIHNEAADGISRVALDSVLADAEAADLAVRRLPACDGAHALMRAVWAEPQAAAGN